MSLTGKVAVVTGAAGNLGSAVTLRMLSAGARVAAAYYVDKELGTLLLQIPDGADLVPIKANVTIEADVERLMDETSQQVGAPDILLNLVGGYDAGAELVNTEEATWDKMMAVNLKSAFLCCKHALRYMLPKDYGRIVSVSSKVAIDLPAKSAAYAVSKAGIVTLTKCLAQELKGTGVSVTAIMPSIIDTPVTRSARPKADPSKWVTPDQIADVLAYLVSERGKAINGAILPVFGGV
jgi:NAD(P)-dependent dehydrogenase (short-subunit alcohol dehydrogenase family)